MRGDSRYKITYSHRRAEAPWPPMEGVSSVALELTDMESVAAALSGSPRKGSHTHGL